MAITKHPIPPRNIEVIKKFAKKIESAFGLDPVFEDLLQAPKEALEILLHNYEGLEDCMRYPLGISPIDEEVVKIVKKLWIYVSGNARSGALTKLQGQIKALCSLAGISDE